MSFIKVHAPSNNMIKPDPLASPLSILSLVELKVLKVREAPEKPGRGPKKKEESVPKEKGA